MKLFDPFPGVISLDSFLSAVCTDHERRSAPIDSTCVRNGEGQQRSEDEPDRHSDKRAVNQHSHTFVSMPALTQENEYSFKGEPLAGF